MNVDVLIVLTVLLKIQAFNLSPKPNLIIKDPKFNRSEIQRRASYFGFSINLRPGG